MQWHEISIDTTAEASEAISHFMHELGAGGVSIEESWLVHQNKQAELGGWYEVPDNGIPLGHVRVNAYFSIDQDSSVFDEKIEQVKQFLEQLGDWGLDKGSAIVSSREVVEDDWAHAWKKYYKPVEISERIVIKPTWEPYEATPEQIVIELDPGMAFGTGTHASTVLSLRLLEQYVQPYDRVIDVGAGSGILSIAAALLGADKVLALDLDPVAVSSTRENALINGMEEQVAIAQSDLLTILKADEAAVENVSESAIAAVRYVEPPVQLIVANILAEILLTFMDDVANALVPGGVYIASGIIRSKADEVEQGMKAAGLQVVERLEEGDWIALAAKKA